MYVMIIDYLLFLGMFDDCREFVVELELLKLRLNHCLDVLAD